MTDRLYVQETARNASENYIIGESDVYETWTDDRGDLFREMQKHYGRCTGRIYIDTEGKTRAVGWVFLRVSTYEDTGEPYKQETWVTVHKAPPTTVRTYHYDMIGTPS